MFKCKGAQLADTVHSSGLSEVRPAFLLLAVVAAAMAPTRIHEIGPQGATASAGATCEAESWRGLGESRGTVPGPRDI